MTTMLARKPYTAPQLGHQYDRTQLRTQLNSLAQSVPPTTGRTVVADTTIVVTDNVVYCDTSGGAIAVTLLPPDQQQFLTVTIINVGNPASTVTVTGTVSGAVNPTLAARWKSITVHSTGAEWVKLASV